MSKVEKQQVPKIRFEGFSDKWSDKVIGDIADIKRGASPRPISDPKWFNDNSAIGWVRISDVTRSFRVLEKTEQYLSDEGVKKSRLIKSGSIIMSICATIGKPVYTAFDVCIHDGFVVFDDLKIDADYTLYFLQTIQDKWYQYGQPGTQVNLNSDIVSNENIKYPSLEEQTQIGNFFQQLDKLIELQTRAVESAESYKKAMLQKMFPQKGEKVPRVRFAGFSGDWIIKNIGSLVSPVKREVSKPDSPYYRLSIRSHARGTFQRLVEDPKQVAMDKLYIVKDGDLVVNITFAWEHAIAIAKKEDDGTLVSHRFPTYIIDKMNADFLGVLIAQKKFKYQLDLISPGGAGRNRVMNQKDFLRIKILLPKLDEQTAIGNFFQKLDQQIEQQAQKLATYQQLKKAMLQRMFV